MDSGYYRLEPVQVLRDRRGIVIGRLEEQRQIGKMLARDARGIVVGIYDRRSNTTRDERGVLIGTGNLLPALLPR